MTDEELLARADEIAARAYSPYSKFEVGSAILARDGTVFVGVNVENAAYPLGICAEKNGIGSAVVEGYGVGDFEAVAITHSPCGGCRQWLWEFRVDRVVFRNQGKVVTMAPSELLPETFDDL